MLITGSVIKKNNIIKTDNLSKNKRVNFIPLVFGNVLLYVIKVKTANKIAAEIR